MITGERPITEKTVLRFEALLNGRFKGWFTTTGIASTLLHTGEDQRVSYLARTLPPSHVAWEEIMQRELSAEFQTVMPDASMAPDVPRGAVVIFVTGVEPEPGDWVLTADNQGHLYLREYRLVRPGHWQAHAVNPAFLPLDSLRDDLRVIAVFDGVRGRKARGINRA